MVYNIDSSDFTEPSVKELARNKFHREVIDMTFGERLTKYGLGLGEMEPRFSSPCNLCEYITLKSALPISA